MGLPGYLQESASDTYKTGQYGVALQIEKSRWKGPAGDSGEQGGQAKEGGFHVVLTAVWDSPPGIHCDGEESMPGWSQIPWFFIEHLFHQTIVYFLLDIQNVISNICIIFIADGKERQR